MKICFWMTSLFTLGGTKRVVTLLANELSKEHDVTIMCHENRKMENRAMYNLDEKVHIKYLNIFQYVDNHQRDLYTIYRKAVLKINKESGYFNTPRRAEMLGRAYFPLKARKALAAAIDKEGYDVVVATARMSLWLAMMTPYLHCKTIGWQHSSFHGYLGVKGFVFWKQEQLLKKYLPKLDAYVVLTEYDQRDYLDKLGIKTVVRYNPCSFISDQKSTLENKHFLMAARLVPLKGFDLMLDAFEEFAKYDNEWDVNILGSGELENSLKAEAQKRGLSSRVHFLGYKNNPQDYYLTSSAYLLTSRYEGWGMVITEAFEFGLPVIAFRIEPFDLLIHEGKTGYLVNAFDTHEFAQAMLRIAHNEKIRKEMGANAVLETARYNIKIIADEWIEMLNSL